MRHVLVVVSVVGILCLGVAAHAQEGLKKVAGWNGEWNLELTGKDSQDAEEWRAEAKGTQHQIGDFCVWTTEWTAPDGKDMTYLGITGWDPAKKQYFGVGVRADGYSERSVVTFGDGTVVYDSTGTTATGDTVRVRCSWTVPKDEYEGKCETLTDGEWWLSGTEKGVRVK